MIKIAICDDEIELLYSLKTKLCSYLDHKNLIYNITFFLSGELFLESSGYFDIIFMDIRMGGMNGMETANKLRLKGLDSHLIFISALKEYVFDAFQVDAVNYLLKPIDDVKLFSSLDKMIHALTTEADDFLLLHSGNNIKKINFTDIFYAEVYNHKVFIHTQQGTETFNKKIESLEQELNTDFFRCHRSYILHLKYVQAYKNGIATLVNGTQIPIAKRRQTAFAKVLLQYQRKEVR